ncbi:HAMP domain-containing sensor histidine kinase [Roseateles asaccharophilus]|uniref:histidine kinase n=1 Tax=Roseateles asaccharophilus TaxID=582607 RepID=A0ABU2A4A1_9BURK|nr:HAMP domain-containing sensor histidine kinase [Roseateles asaccharophilus]MDR7332031.1 signal transduction histidine kinase [Roseateles asaccharophilus]
MSDSPPPALPPRVQPAQPAWQGWQRSSLTVAVVLALLLGLLLPTTAVLLFDVQKTRATAMEDLKRDLARATEVMALSLAEPVWQVSPDLADPMVKAQMDDPRFVSVQVVEPASTTPFLSQQNPGGHADPDLVLSQTRPVLRDGREIAKLTVRMSAAPLLEAKQAEIWRTVWRSGLTLTLSLVLILWVLQRYVLRPMMELTASAEALAAGRLEQPLHINSGGDEIARVGVAMERMRQALLSAFEALRQHNLNLEETVTQRTAELTASNAELSEALATLQKTQRDLVESEKLASLGRLVAGVAHELNTPLGNALTVVSTLDDRYKQLEGMLAGGGAQLRRSTLEELARDTRRAQDILQRNVQKAADLVRDFKQVAIDQTADLRRDFDLGKVVEDVLVMVEPSFKYTPHVIETDLCHGLRMNSYPGALGQVLTNLLMNALLHGFEGMERGHVKVHCERLGDTEAELSVIDDGRGMDESVRRRIFDPFFTTKLGTGGSGLGMHIVHNIVTNVLGGQIEVRSTPGQGTQMLMRLPLLAPQRAGEATGAR